MTTATLRATVLSDILVELEEALHDHPQMMEVGQVLEPVIAKAVKAAADHRLRNHTPPAALKTGSATDFVRSINEVPRNSDGMACDIATHVLSLDDGFDADTARRSLEDSVRACTYSSFSDVWRTIIAEAMSAVSARTGDVTVSTSSTPAELHAVADALLVCAESISQHTQVSAPQLASPYKRMPLGASESVQVQPCDEGPRDISDVTAVGPAGGGHGECDNKPNAKSDEMARSGDAESGTADALGRSPSWLEVARRAAAAARGPAGSRRAQRRRARDLPRALDSISAGAQVSAEGADGSGILSSPLYSKARLTTPLAGGEAAGVPEAKKEGEGDGKIDVEMGTSSPSPTPVDAAASAGGIGGSDDGSDASSPVSVVPENSCAGERGEDQATTGADCDAAKPLAGADSTMDVNVTSPTDPDAKMVLERAGDVQSTAAELVELRRLAGISADDLLKEHGGPTMEAGMAARANLKAAMVVAERLMRDLFKLDELVGLSEVGRSVRKATVKSVQKLLSQADDIVAQLQKVCAVVEKQVAEAKDAKDAEAAAAGVEADAAGVAAAASETSPHTAEGSGAYSTTSTGEKYSPYSTGGAQPSSSPSNPTSDRVAMVAEQRFAQVLEVLRTVPPVQWMPPAELWRDAEASAPFRVATTRGAWIAQCAAPGVDSRSVSIRVRDDDTPASLVVSYVRLPTPQDIISAQGAIISTLRAACLKATAADAMAGECVHQAGSADGLCPFTGPGMTAGILHAAVLEALRGRFGSVSEELQVPAAADLRRLNASYERGMIVIRVPWRLRDVYPNEQVNPYGNMGSQRQPAARRPAQYNPYINSNDPVGSMMGSLPQGGKRGLGGGGRPFGNFF